MPSSATINALSEPTRPRNNPYSNNTLSLGVSNSSPRTVVMSSLANIIMPKSNRLADFTSVSINDSLLLKMSSDQRWQSKSSEKRS